MTAIVWTDVVVHAPALAGVSTEFQDDILAYVNEALKVSEFGGEDAPKTKLARIYLAAHFGTAANQASTGQTGPVTSESVGGISRSYGSVTFDSGSLGQTLWGQLFAALVNTSYARAPIVL